MDGGGPSTEPCENDDPVGLHQSSGQDDVHLQSSAPQLKGFARSGSSPIGPPSSVNRAMSSPQSDDPVQEGTRNQHPNQASYVAGCGDEQSQSHDDGEIIDQSSSGIGDHTADATPVTRAVHCEHPGCDKKPRYGQRNEQPRLCQVHKRAGQYTVHNSQLYIATRDGRAFREQSGVKSPVAAAAGVSHAVSRSSEESQPTPPATEAVTMPSVRVTPKNLCEEPNCDVESTYGINGSGKPRFCSRHKTKSQVRLSNTSCLLPRGGRNPGDHLHESNDQHEPKDDITEAMAPAETPDREQRERGNVIEMSRRKGKGPARAESCAQSRTKEANSNAKNSQREESLQSTPLVPCSSHLSLIGQGNQSSLRSCKADAPRLSPSDLAPSEEIKLFQQARESARLAAEASGPGRRARPPSRRCLEASGKLVGDTIQWMTKNKKEEEARMKLKLKEQRKAAAAAGLKFGHVLEAVDVSASRDAKVAAGIEQLVDDDAINDTALNGCEGMPSSVPRQQQLAPVKSGWAGGEVTTAREARQKSNGSIGTAAEASFGSGKNIQDEATPQSSTRENAFLKKREEVVSEGGVSSRQGLPLVVGDGRRRSKRTRTAPGGAASNNVTCESEGCSETATYGINNTERFCHAHRIFGMYRIGGY